MLYAIFFCTIAGLLTASTLARAQMPPEFAGRWGVICAWERCPWSEFQLGDKYRDIKNGDLWYEIDMSNATRDGWRVSATRQADGRYRVVVIPGYCREDNPLCRDENLWWIQRNGGRTLWFFKNLDDGRIDVRCKMAPSNEPLHELAGPNDRVEGSSLDKNWHPKCFGDD